VDDIILDTYYRRLVQLNGADHKIRFVSAIPDMETDQCFEDNGGCWRDEKTNITACKVPISSFFSKSRNLLVTTDSCKVFDASTEY
jgi:hypothetical protein